MTNQLPFFLSLPTEIKKLESGRKTIPRRGDLESDERSHTGSDDTAEAHGRVAARSTSEDRRLGAGSARDGGGLSGAGGDRHEAGGGGGGARAGSSRGRRLGAVAHGGGDDVDGDHAGRGRRGRLLRSLASHNSNRSRSRGRDSSGRRGGRDIVVILDAKLGRVLVLASALDDKQDTVVRHIGLEAVLGGPDVAAGVVDVLDDGLKGNGVGGRSTEEDQRDLARGRGLPGNGVGGAGGDLLVQAREDDGVARGSVGEVGLGVGVGDAGREGGEDGDGGDGEAHFVVFFLPRDDLALQIQRVSGSTK